MGWDKRSTVPMSLERGYWVPCRKGHGGLAVEIAIACVLLRLTDGRPMG
jgi:hypothetical protein